MARVTIDLAPDRWERLAEVATASGRSVEETASDLVAQALDPWVRASRIVDEARRNANLSDEDAEEVATSEVESMRRERRTA